MNNVQTIGIIGLGSFGKFVASLISPAAGIKVYGYDTRGAAAEGVVSADLATTITSDIVLIATPLAAYPELLRYLKKHIKPETLLVDICSVKVLPEQYFATYLPDHPNLLMTHPLFGPQSAENGTAGHTLIVTMQKGSLATSSVHYCEQKLGLKVQRMTSEEHDKQMAYVHALTFFIARGLSQLPIEDNELSMTPSYQMIKDLIEFDHTHSDELFHTIQNGNPYAAEIRSQVVKSFTDLEASLTEGMTT